MVVGTQDFYPGTSLAAVGISGTGLGPSSVNPRTPSMMRTLDTDPDEEEPACTTGIVDSEAACAHTI